MNKQDLCEQADLSRATIAKLGKGRNVNTNVLLKICKALDCQIEEICQIEKEEE